MEEVAQIPRKPIVKLGDVMGVIFSKFDAFLILQFFAREIWIRVLDNWAKLVYFTRQIAHSFIFMIENRIQTFDFLKKLVYHVGTISWIFDNFPDSFISYNGN